VSVESRRLRRDGSEDRIKRPVMEPDRVGTSWENTICNTEICVTITSRWILEKYVLRLNATWKCLRNVCNGGL